MIEFSHRCTRMDTDFRMKFDKEATEETEFERESRTHAEH